MMATSITKQPRRTQFTTNYRTAEEDLFHINYKIAKNDLIYNKLQNSRGRLDLQLTTERSRCAGGKAI